MGADRKQDIVRRLKSVEGHIRGIERMVEEDAYCVEVVNQILAVQRALKKVSGLVLDQHLHSCVTHAIQGSDTAAKERVLGELLEVLMHRHLIMEQHPINAVYPDRLVLHDGGNVVAGNADVLETDDEQSAELHVRSEQQLCAEHGDAGTLRP